MKKEIKDAKTWFPTGQTNNDVSKIRGGGGSQGGGDGVQITGRELQTATLRERDGGYKHA